MSKCLWNAQGDMVCETTDFFYQPSTPPTSSPPTPHMITHNTIKRPIQIPLSLRPLPAQVLH